ncbi:MAG: NAD(P)/FAD-dependent oxidoreductase [Rhodocyclaceae bacterium]|nr:NAD(P)/FAD-dependent oxidoreductase [Rhodocyclaceae bacterium]
MTNWTRRHFLGAAGAGSLLAGFPAIVRSATKARIVIVGGGFGGAIAARYLKMADAGIDVTLIERNKQYVCCPFSNEVISGERDISTLYFDLRAMATRGVNVVYDEVTAIDPAKKTVATRGGKQFGYDRLILSPGVELDYASVEGATPDIETVMPHAWKAGEQTLLLKKQLHEMKDGGLAIITVPKRPYRCPPGPYERASLMAHYMKHHKPRSKVLILDEGETMPKQSLFHEGWEKLYPGLVTWTTGNNGGKILRVDVKKRALITDVGDYEADVMNFIPPQKAAAIAQKTGLTNKDGWCPVDPVTMESTLQKGIHVIGDAALAGDMPKSAHVAAAQAKVVVRAIIAQLDGKPAPTPYYVNTCYTLMAPDYGFSIAGLYTPSGGNIVAVKDSVTVSPMRAPAYVRKAEAEYGYSWLKNITAEAFL